MVKIAVVRVRGAVGTTGTFNDTMRMLALTRVNHCSIVEEAQLGMVKLCKDYLTWGEVEAETLGMMIAKRGMKAGNKKVTEEDIAKTSFKTIDAFVKTFMNSEAKLSDIGIKKVFRLHPPRKGYSFVKKTYPEGALGYRKGEINALLKRMM